MKEMKGRFLSKLNLISAVNTLKQGLVSKKNPPEKLSLHNFQTTVVYKQEKPLQDDNTGIVEHVTDRQDKEKEWDSNVFHIRDMGNNEIITFEAQKYKQEFPFLSEGRDTVVFYTTSLRGIRKTFEDCSTIRFLLESLKISFHERDVSMHLEFREELWRIFGGRVIPPKLFIKGRCIGGSDEVVALHEQGELRKLLEGIPRKPSFTPCNGCANKRFVVCSNCDGSRKVVQEGEKHEFFVRCQECNENGLIKCPICC